MTAILTSLKHENACPRRVWEREELEDKRRRNLVGRIAYADVELREGGLDDVSQEDLELPLFWLPLDALRHFGRHAGVHLDGDDLLGLFQDSDCQVTRTRSDLEDSIGRLEVRLVDDLFGYTGVLEDICKAAHQRFGSSGQTGRWSYAGHSPSC